MFLTYHKFVMHFSVICLHFIFFTYIFSLTKLYFWVPIIIFVFVFFFQMKYFGKHRILFFNLTEISAWQFVTASTPKVIQIRPWYHQKTLLHKT